MLRRITTTIVAALAALTTLVGSALALPGEGYGVDPYGIPMTDAPAQAPAEAVGQAVSGWVLEPIVLIVALVVLAAVMAGAGYATGIFHHRRLALH